MSGELIIWAVAGIALGSVVTFVICKALLGKKAPSSDSLGEIDTLKTKLAQAEIDAEKRFDDQKRKYDELLVEAKTKCSELDNQLKSALEGKIEESVQVQLASIEKLKRKIKDLEDDLDEKDDDLSDYKKKISKKDNEIVELQDSLSKEQKVSNALHSELEAKKKDLEDAISDLNLKVGSLGFIQEILSAKDISTTDATTIIKNVDQFESFIKGQYLDLNAFLYKSFQSLQFAWKDIQGSRGFDAKKEWIIQSFDQWASTKKKSWLDNKTTIAFVGEFSAGKTSIVNRILSQDNPNIPQLPVSAKATTAIPTYIAGGQSTSYNFISGDGRCKTILEDTFKKVSKDVLDQIKGVSSLIKYFVMTYNNPNLKGLSILDTPGFNSNDKEDRMRTIDVINECDALFWVFDVNAGTVNRSSLAIIKEKLNKPLYVVINKVDTKADSEVQKVEDLIRKTLKDEGINVQQFIRFSSKAPLNTIMDPIKKVNKIAARDTFVSDVETDIHQLLDILDNAVKESTADYNNAQKQGDQITDQYIARMRSIQADCERAYGIPQFKEGFKVFGIGSDDKYVMTIYQTQQLQNLLSTIANAHIQSLAQNFDDRVDKAAEIQAEWSTLCENKNAWQKINDCLHQFDKLRKNFS